MTGAYCIKYKIDKDYYEFKNHLKALKDKNLKIKIEFDVSKNDKQIDISEIKLPNKILANAIMLNDKFPMVYSKPEDVYQYMGIRRSPSVAGTRTFIRRTVSNIADAMNNDSFKDNLKNILSFLGLKQILSIYYYPKYKHYFFKGDLTIKKFMAFFENWKDITKRKTPPWGSKYYNKIKDNTSELKTIVNFINFITPTLKKESARTKYLEYDILSSNRLKEDFELLEKLSALDLLIYPGLSLGKEDEYGLEDSSSGEFHFLAVMLGMTAKVKEDSLILIDEPEISLHPNWQMKYINFLKTIFREYKSTHFIIASHSHFLVSDLEKETSSIIGLKRNTAISPISAEFIEKNTYGWTAEDVLYNIFKAPTTRNYYLANEIGEILKLISKKEQNIGEIKKKVAELKKININLNEVDPLKDIVEKLIDKFGKRQDD